VDEQWQGVVHTGCHCKRTTKWKSLLFNICFDSRGGVIELRLWWVNIGGYVLYRPRPDRRLTLKGMGPNGNTTR
jgi:hypothetical protein